jgi:hypothetical protein
MNEALCDTGNSTASPAVEGWQAFVERMRRDATDPMPLRDYADWLEAQGETLLARFAREAAERRAARGREQRLRLA